MYLILHIKSLAIDCTLLNYDTNIIWYGALYNFLSNQILIEHLIIYVKNRDNTLLMHFRIFRIHRFNLIISKTYKCACIRCINWKIYFDDGIYIIISKKKWKRCSQYQNNICYNRLNKTRLWYLDFHIVTMEVCTYHD